MRHHFYPFDSLNPDQGDRGNSGLLYVTNANPIAGIYVPGPGAKLIRATDDTGALANNALALHSHGDYVLWATSYIEAGTPAKVYVSDIYGKSATNDEFNATPVSWNESATKNNRSFASFGEEVYFAHEGNKIYSLNLQTWTPGTTKFAQPTPASGATLPGANHIISHGGHLVACGIELFEDWGGFSNGDKYPNLVWWSKFDDPASFASFAVAPEIVGSDYKFLYDTPGDITGAVSTGDHMFIFKADAIYLGEGPPFRFSLLTQSIGTRCPNSILFHNGWTYFMSENGPARINIRGEYEILGEGKIKSTLDLNAYVPFYDNNVASFFMSHFGLSGVWGKKTDYVWQKVYTALSEQYNMVYFLYPSRTETEGLFGLGITKRVGQMCLMSYDMLSSEVGFSLPIASDAIREGAEYPWNYFTYPGSSGYNTKGSYAMFAMTTLHNKPSRGKAKDVVLLGTNDTTTQTGTDLDEWDLNKSWYYLEPTIFFGTSSSDYTSSVFGTKIWAPSSSFSRIRKVRPVMRIGYGAESYSPFAKVITVHDRSVTANDIWRNYDPLAEDGGLKPDPPTVHVATESQQSGDGGILMGDTVFGPEHIIIFGFHTEAAGGPGATPDYITSTGILGIEIWFDEQGLEAR